MSYNQHEIKNFVFFFRIQIPVKLNRDNNFIRFVCLCQYKKSSDRPTESETHTCTETFLVYWPYEYSMGKIYHANSSHISAVVSISKSTKRIRLDT